MKHHPKGERLGLWGKGFEGGFWNIPPNRGWLSKKMAKIVQGFGKACTICAGIWKSLHKLCRDLKKPALIVQGFVKACTDYAGIWKSPHKIWRQFVQGFGEACTNCARMCKSLQRLCRDLEKSAQNIEAIGKMQSIWNDLLVTIPVEDLNNLELLYMGSRVLKQLW